MQKEQFERVVEWGLILFGLFSLAWLLGEVSQGHEYMHKPILGDGVDRFQSLSAVLSGAELSSMAVNFGNRLKFSLIGPLFSAPLWLLGRSIKSPEFWCITYNLFLLGTAVVAFSFLLKNTLPPKVTRAFLLLVIYASMFPHHVQNYYGEVFSALLIAVGIAGIRLGKLPFLNSLGVALGVANSPSTVVGYVLVSFRQFFEKQKISLLLPLGAGIFLISLESFLRSGSVMPLGYEGNRGFTTQLPYSGLPGFSYPFLLGALSILFSFGKGLLFFVPGLFLPGKNWAEAYPKIHQVWIDWLFFVVGLVLIYSKWWAWYGGSFWGPRFFLFSCIPASMALAAHLSVRGKPQFKALLLIALTLSFWVGISGAVFGQEGIEQICSADNYRVEAFCWYVPEFSPLVWPFIGPHIFKAKEIFFIVLSTITYLWLSVPLYRELIPTLIQRFCGKSLQENATP